MEAKYNAAIKAGVIGSILLAGYAVLQLLLNIVSGLVSIPLGMTCWCLWLPVLIILGAVTGAMAVNFASKVVTKLVDGIIVAAVAGAIAGVISVIIAVVIAFLAPLLNIDIYKIAPNFGLAIPVALSMSAFWGSIACLCAPVYVIIIIIMAVIGGAIWGALKLKLT